MSKDYTQAKIYQIKVNTDEEYLPYIGSTCKNYLSQRMSYHHQDYKKYKNKPEKYSYISSFILFDKFGVENCFIELIELFPCNCNDELRKKEREWMEKINCCNKVKRPIISTEEKSFYDKEKNQKRLLKNPEFYKEKYQKELLKNPEFYKEKYQDTLLKNPNHCKELYKLQLQNPSYKIRVKKRYTCELCIEELLLNGKSRHERSLKHINNINLAKST